MSEFSYLKLGNNCFEDSNRVIEMCMNTKVGTKLTAMYYFFYANVIQWFLKRILCIDLDPLLVQTTQKKCQYFQT